MCWICAFSPELGRLTEGWWNDEHEKLHKGHFRRGEAGCHILWFMSLYTQSVTAFDMFPSGIFTAVRWMWISTSQYIVQHWITIPTVLQYIEKLQYQWGISSLLPSRKPLSFVMLPLCPETQSPWCGLGHWSQWEKMVSLSLSPDATHAAFSSFFF